VREGDSAFAWRVKDGVLNKVPVTLGARDARSGAYSIAQGLADGDIVLRYPSSVLKDGQKTQTAVANKAGVAVPMAAK
jgi:hypothetical protein